MTESGRDPRAVDTSQRERFVHFLTLRLTEELARLWEREEHHRDDGRPRPGLPAQLTVVDELLRHLATGHLPDRNDLVVLHTAYRTHPDYDPTWSTLA